MLCLLHSCQYDVNRALPCFASLETAPQAPVAKGKESKENKKDKKSKETAAAAAGAETQSTSNAVDAVATEKANELMRLEYQRPLDRYLLPLQNALERKLNAYADPTTLEEHVFTLVDRAASSSCDRAQAMRLLAQSAQMLQRKEDEERKAVMDLRYNEYHQRKQEAEAAVQAAAELRRKQEEEEQKAAEESAADPQHKKKKADATRTGSAGKTKNKGKATAIAAESELVDPVKAIPEPAQVTDDELWDIATRRLKCRMWFDIGVAAWDRKVCDVAEQAFRHVINTKWDPMRDKEHIVQQIRSHMLLSQCIEQQLQQQNIRLGDVPPPDYGTTSVTVDLPSEPAAQESDSSSGSSKSARVTSAGKRNTSKPADSKDNKESKDGNGKKSRETSAASPRPKRGSVIEPAEATSPRAVPSDVTNPSSGSSDPAPKVEAPLPPESRTEKRRREKQESEEKKQQELHLRVWSMQLQVTDHAVQAAELARAHGEEWAVVNASIQLWNMHVHLWQDGLELFPLYLLNPLHRCFELNCSISNKDARLTSQLGDLLVRVMEQQALKEQCVVVCEAMLQPDICPVSKQTKVVQAYARNTALGQAKDPKAQIFQQDSSPFRSLMFKLEQLKLSAQLTEVNRDSIKLQLNEIISAVAGWSPSKPNSASVPVDSKSNAKSKRQTVNKSKSPEPSVQSTADPVPAAALSRKELRETEEFRTLHVELLSHVAELAITHQLTEVAARACEVAVADIKGAAGNTATSTSPTSTSLSSSGPSDAKQASPGASGCCWQRYYWFALCECARGTAVLATVDGKTQDKATQDLVRRWILHTCVSISAQSMNTIRTMV